MLENNIIAQKIINKIKEIKDDASKQEVWELVNMISREYQTNIDATHRRNTGVYYTGLELARHMVEDLFSKFDFRLENLQDKLILEPCVGTGNFIFAILDKIHDLGGEEHQVKNILNNIYVVDIDEEALSIYKSLVQKVSKVYFGIIIEETYFETHIGRGLIFNFNSESLEYIGIQDVFPNLKRKFDIVITNPPYKTIKAEKNKYLNDEEADRIKKQYEKVSKFIKNTFKYSNEGIVNLYKIFIEEIICNYTSADAKISLLIPATILTDKTCCKLRTMILKNCKLSKIETIPENTKFIDAQQATCTLLINKGEVTNYINIVKNINLKSSTEGENIEISDILNEYTGNAIFPLTKTEYIMLKNMRRHPVIKELDFIKNLRGELDITLNRDSIVKENTENVLLRGKNIGYYFKKEDVTEEYVDQAFIANTPKRMYIEEERIACQQVVNIHKERRITFSYIEKGYVLGNSCNFLSVMPNEQGISLYTVLGIMNSSLINWMFKLISSNNHVNNYEIDALPIPIAYNRLNEIGEKVKIYLKSKDEKLVQEIDYLVTEAFNYNEDVPRNREIAQTEDRIAERLQQDIISIIKNNDFHICHAQDILRNGTRLEAIMNTLGIESSTEEIELINYIIEKYKKISNGQVLNHTTFKLSELDLEMIKSVPQGGNWQNIPPDVIAKSQRLTKISQSGGRTTLYGRIDYSKPSYTITTYFNRPGNGAYIHPEHERVISVREAARLQSFKDDYMFVGNKSDILKQVGNAVPPLLAYEIAKQVKKHVECNNSIDLFCGAGGMSVGFKEAGIEAIVANDFDKSACKTFKINNPEINVICGDITTQEVKEKIYAHTKGLDVDLVCGGPPCQGFSLAGKRFVDDPRNQLFKDFIDVVSHIKPKIVIMENVKGMLSFMKGEIYNQVIELYQGLGYNVEGRVLVASEYGVPQKRHRVIIICVRKDLNITPDILFPEKTTQDSNLQITSKQAIGDLAKIPCEDEAYYLDTCKENISDYACRMRGLKIENESSVIKVKTEEMKYKKELKQLSLFE